MSGCEAPLKTDHRVKKRRCRARKFAPRRKNHHRTVLAAPGHIDSGEKLPFCNSCEGHGDISSTVLGVSGRKRPLNKSFGSKIWPAAIIPRSGPNFCPTQFLTWATKMGARGAPILISPLPDARARTWGDVHLVARLDAERLIEGVDVSNRDVGAIPFGRVGV